MTLVALCSCDPTLNGIHRPDTGGGSPSSSGNREPAGVSDDGKAHIYFTAVSFPESYEWRRDTAYGAVAGAILLYMDGEPILTLPAGSSGGISCDPDMHHLAGGHIYTEFSDASHTMIGCDGKELFRYDGRELLKGLIIDGKDVLTLGQNRSGSGFSLRRNGKVLLQKPEGEIVGGFSDRSSPETGALSIEGGRICFCYHDGKGWHFVEDGSETLLTVKGEKIGTCYDMKVFGDTRCAVVSLGSTRGPILVAGDKTVSFAGSLIGAPSNDYRLHHEDGRILVTGMYYTYNRDLEITGFWDEDGKLHRIDGDCRYFTAKGSGYDFVVKDHGHVVSVSRSGKSTAISGSWAMMTPHCLCWHGKETLLALTPASGASGYPVLWHDGEMTEVRINGFLTAAGVGY